MMSDSAAIGLRARSRVVEMPISAPRPSSPPSLKRDEALTITTGLRIAGAKRCATASSAMTMTSVWPEP